MRNQLVIVTAVLVFARLGVFATIAPAIEPSQVADLLAEQILEPNLPLTELQRYAEPRIAELRQFDSRAAWEEYAEQLRREVLDRVVFRGEAVAWRDASCAVEWGETMPGGPGYRLRKLRYEALPDMWVPAVLYEPETLEGKVPVVLNVNGHDGEGKAAPYKQLRCINLAKRGMLALNVEWFGMGQLRGDGFLHYRMNQIDLCGTSGLAPFYLAMQRGLDVLLSLPSADGERVAVAGLSGGGWQTIFISSLDPRVTAANPVAGYSSYRTRLYEFSDLGDSEQTPVDLAMIADYVHLTALRAPRPTLLTYNAHDQCCFKASHALPPLLDTARPIFALYDKADALTSHINEDPGTHNFEQENREAFYKLLKDSFAPDDDSFSTCEIPSEDELKTAEELHVDLPEDNANFQALATMLARDLPRRVAPKAGIEGAEQWQRQQRDALRSLVKYKDYVAKGWQTKQRGEDDVTARYWRITLDRDWTVPVIELEPANPQATVIVLADEGRVAAAEIIAAQLNDRRRVLTVDPFYFGESKIAGRDFLMALLLSSIGDRPLGVQASQVAAVARWAKSRHDGQRVSVLTVGPRMTTIALVATASDESSIDAIELHEPLASLKEVIEQNWSVDQRPEMFCFGLLEQFDIRDLIALATPRSVEIHGLTDRMQTEWSDLDEWYARWSAEFGPLR